MMIMLKLRLKIFMTISAGYRTTPGTTRTRRTDPGIVARFGRARAGMLLWGIALLTTGHGAQAPDESTAAPVPPGQGVFPAIAPFAYGDDELLIPEVFQGHLPTTLEKYAVRLSVNPHIGDWRNKDHMRLSTGLRYGLTGNWEISAASDLYFSHGAGEIRAFENYGAANVRVGTKINLGEPFLAGWKIGTGFDYLFPTGRPPAELTDGLRHFMPYVTFSHRLESHPDIRIFWGFRWDEVTHTSITGEFGKNAFHESSAGITGGWVIDRKNWHYTMEAAYDTTRWMGHSSVDVYTIRPGVLWEIPKRHNRQMKSNWVVGVAVKSTFGPGGTSLGASLRLRYSRDFKKIFRHKPAASAP